MRHFQKVLVGMSMLGALLVGTLQVGTAAAATTDIGIRSLSVQSSERKAAIDLTVWYPANSEGTVEEYGSSALFAGVPGRRNASWAVGTFPLVLMAGGGLRSSPTLFGWIGAHLASRGYVVAVVHAPAIDPKNAGLAVNEIWLRPRDLSVALDAVTAHPDTASHINPGKVAALGFFLGGTSSLALGGVRLDPGIFRQLCDGPPQMPDCGWFAKNKVDLHAVDEATVSASHHDPRVKMVVAVNPELSSSFAESSLSEIKIPVALINLGSPSNGPPGLDASVLNSRLSGASYQAIPDASPFSAFSECGPKAKSILAEEGEDEAICGDGGQRSRKDIHSELGQAIERALGNGLSDGP
jgi:predicted dienelactone hydrolase